MDRSSLRHSHLGGPQEGVLESSWRSSEPGEEWGRRQRSRCEVKRCLLTSWSSLLLLSPGDRSPGSLPGEGHRAECEAPLLLPWETSRESWGWDSGSYTRLHRTRIRRWGPSEWVYWRSCREVLLAPGAWKSNRSSRRSWSSWSSFLQTFILSQSALLLLLPQDQLPEPLTLYKARTHTHTHRAEPDGIRL